MKDRSVAPQEDVPLSLREALRLAFRQNLDLQSERYTSQIARFGIQKARGGFDFRLFSTFGLTASSTPISSQLQGQDIAYLKTHNRTFDVGLSKLVKTGGIIELKLDMNRLKSNSSFLILNPSYTTGLNLSLQQPLLRNAGIAFQDAPIRIARNLYLMSKDQWEAFVADVLVSVSQAYWDLVFAYQNVQLRRESLGLAKDLLRNNEVQARLGTMAPIDLVQSQAGVALREQELVTAEAALETAQDALKQLLHLEEAPTYSLTRVIPTDTPSPPPAREKTRLEDAISLALENRPEYRAALKDLETKNLQIKVAANQLLPLLDLTGSVGLNGLAGTAIESTSFSAIQELPPLEQLLVLAGLAPAPTIRSPLDGSLDRSLEEMFNPDSYQWSIGIRLEWPLENREARANYMEAKLEAQKSLWSLRSLAQKIVLEVKEAWRDIEVNRRKVRISQRNEEFARRQLEAEQKRLSLGLSTNYQVLKMEEDLRDAQINTLKAKIDYWKARAKMLRATGVLLQEEGISVEEGSQIGRGRDENQQTGLSWNHRPIAHPCGHGDLG